MLHSAETNLKIEYIREYNFIFNGLSPWFKGPRGIVCRKNRGSKTSLRAFSFGIVIRTS
jgi:hypothetical protein